MNFKYTVRTSLPETFILIRISVLVIFNLLVCQGILAVTAYPYAIDSPQPDGKVVRITMMGDEWVRWAETSDHFTLLRNSRGAWEYAVKDRRGEIVPSGFLAHDPADRDPVETSFLAGIEQKLSFSAAQIGILRSVRSQQNNRAVSGYPTNGTINQLMILIGFADKPFTRTQTDFASLMNQVNFNGTGSFRDFYLQNSYGQLTVNTVVSGIYVADHNMAYYGTNVPFDDYRVGELVLEAVNKADPYVNYADFDNDNDGNVDGIYMIYAGYGEEAGGGADAIWAHASSITPVVRDGKNVSKYACSAELRGNSGTDITGIGVICHEFGHSLGAPDYYDTDYAVNGEYDGTGQWDMMAGGSWNNSGDIPAHHNPFTKYMYYNWLTPVVVSTAQELTLRNIRDFPDVYRINTTTANEYFLCENRQPVGFNAYCPGHGMIIYHVDGTYINAHFNPNDINSGPHQGMFPMSAVATTSNGVMTSAVDMINVPGCPWPGTENKTLFSDATTPWSKSWAGNNTSKPFLSIAESGGNIVFCLISCDVNKPGSLTATPVSSTQINLSWTKNPSGNPVLIAVNTINSFGTPVNGTSYSAGNPIAGGGNVIYTGADLSCTHDDLSPATAYYYKAWSVMSGNIYSAGIISNGTTFCILPYTQPFQEVTMPVYWSQVDHQGSGQIWQFGTMTGYGSSNPALDGNYAFLNSDAYGEGGTQDADLVSPALDLTDLTAVTLQFDHYFRQYNAATGTLSYSINNGTTWMPVQQWTSSTSNPATFSQVIPAVAGQAQVKFKWNFSGSWEYYWALDNVSVTGLHGPTWTGAFSSDWNTAGNWLGDIVPGQLNNVIIPLTGRNPVVNTPAGSPATCRRLTIQPGAVLTINPGKALQVNGTLTIQP